MLELVTEKQNKTGDTLTLLVDTSTEKPPYQYYLQTNGGEFSPITVKEWKEL